MADLLLAESKNIKNFFAQRIFILLSLNGLLFFLCLFICFQVFLLNRKPTPTLVQLQTGQVASVVPADSLHRSDLVIKTFINEVMSGFYSWSGLKKEYRNGKIIVVKDRGWQLGTKTIPTSAYRSGLALESSFRDGFLQELSDIVPPEIFGNSIRLTSTYLPVLINKPQLIEAGKWKLVLVAEVIVSANRGEKISSKSIPLTKEIILQATTPLEPKSEYISESERWIHEVRKYGLEIVTIEDFSEKITTN